MTEARRCPRIAPDHPSAPVPDDHAFAPAPDDHPSARDPHEGEEAPAHSPSLPDAAPLHGPSGTAAVTPTHSRCIPDATAKHGRPAGAVYDPETRAFYDGETGALLADEAAWERASGDQHDKARARLAAVRRAESLIALGIPRCEADAAAAAEAGIASGVLGRWRRKQGAGSAQGRPRRRPARRQASRSTFPDRCRGARDAGGPPLRPWRSPHRRARAPHAARKAWAGAEGPDRPRMASALAERERARPARRHQSRPRPLTPQTGRW